MGNGALAMGYNPSAQNNAAQRKVTPGTLSAAASMSALSDATPPSPSIASIDGDEHNGGGEMGVREHASEKREAGVKARKRRREGDS